MINTKPFKRFILFGLFSWFPVLLGCCIPLGYLVADSSAIMNPGYVPTMSETMAAALLLQALFSIHLLSFYVLSLIIGCIYDGRSV